MLITTIESVVEGGMPRSLRRHASVRGQRGLGRSRSRPSTLLRVSGKERDNAKVYFPSTRFAMKMSGFPGPLASGSAPTMLNPTFR